MFKYNDKPTIYQRIYQFNKDAGTPMSQNLLTTKQYVNEIDMLQEEIQELLEAFRKEDRVEMADALGDIIYVAMGCMGKLGIDYDRVMNEICKSNETKYQDGVLVKNENGKIVKGPNFQKPDLTLSKYSNEFKMLFPWTDEGQDGSAQKTNEKGS